jgi:hypothetical protein
MCEESSYTLAHPSPCYSTVRARMSGAHLSGRLRRCYLGGVRKVAVAYSAFT